ncbi:16209_t:CDS:2 [Dentiscutata heterogama]|uniref:16209_t:CDS:1 n=1 Tax=Dentiscutata heterogama TaxID=1316150 RepID=A0ACA9JZX2_9GLOM|nr:16209_t:CDS:2 [Dentiscutata heterogama]
MQKAKDFIVDNKNIVAIGAITIGGLVFTPIAIVGIVQAIGFGAGGIAAGSFAAWLMSLQGGATAAGSLVAILQSVGAAGLTAGATIGSGAAGASVMGILGKLFMDKLDANPEGQAQLEEYVKIYDGDNNESSEEGSSGLVFEIRDKLLTEDKAFDNFLEIFTSTKLANKTKQFKFLVDKAEDYNVIIQAGDPTNHKEFKAHSVLLRARCGYFRSALSNDWPRKSGDIIVFRKPNIPSGIFEIILNDELQLPILISHAQDYLIKTQTEWINQTLVPILHIVCHHGTFGKLRDYTLKTVCAKLLPSSVEEQILQFYLDPDSRVHNVFLPRNISSEPIDSVLIDDSSQIVGGYNPIKWNFSNFSENSHGASVGTHRSFKKFGSTLDSFIFSFNDTHNPTTATLSRINESLDDEAIYFSHSYGPCFGQNDLHMVDQSWNCRKTSYSNEILTGKSNFIAEDYEVFQIVENDGLKEKKTEVLEERQMFIHSFDGYIR